MHKISRRVALASTALLLASCASVKAQDEYPPIVFVPGAGDSAAIWQTTIWRFESNGWPRDRLFAIELPYPVARDDDTRAQPGRSSTAEHRAFIQAEVDRVLRATGAKQVVLVGLSRGGLGIRDYVQNGGGDKTVSHAILGGTMNHGIYRIAGLNETSEYSGTGPYITGLNRPKNTAGDEVTGPVKWLSLRSDKNDKYAQPDGLWIGQRGVATNIGFDGPDLRGATNVVLASVDHRETVLSARAFDAMYRFITGRAPATTDVAAEDRVTLSGKVVGLGLSPTDPASGSFATNLPLAGAKLEVYAIDPVQGERRGAPVYSKSIGADGAWGPMPAQHDTRYEFVVSAPGYATMHLYRSPFPRSSSVFNIRARRIADVDKNAPAIVAMWRPRGYLDPGRDKMAFDGISPPPGAVLGAGVDTSTIKPNGLTRAVVAEFNGERVIGRSWPASDNQLSVLELTN